MVYTHHRDVKLPEHRVLLVYKSFANDPQISHIGLGISAKAASLVLAQAGIHAEPLPVFDGYELEKKLKVLPGVTHVVLYAPWIDMGFLGGLAKRWPKINFTVTIHSNIAFLQSDSFSVKIMRQGTDLSKTQENFTISSNSTLLVNFIKSVYGTRCPQLSNLYPLGERPTKVHHDRVRLGLFGAIRPLKNVLSGVAAAVLLSKERPVDLCLSGGRIEGGEGILRAVNELITDQAGLNFILSPWQPWEEFTKFVATQDILLQPSFSESFNNVTADGAAQYIPSVVGPAISWAPNYWKADPEDTAAIKNKIVELLNCPNAGTDGFHALQLHNQDGIPHWKQFVAKGT